MTSATSTSRDARPSLKPGSALVRRTATSLLGVAMLVTLSETASAEDQAGPPADTSGLPRTAAPRAATSGSATSDSEASGSAGEADAPPPSASSPAAPTKPNTLQEPAAPARTSSPVEPDDAAEADPSTSCDPPNSEEAMAPSSSLSPEQSRALWPLSWKKSPGQGFSFGMEEGLWGNSWSQGLRVTIPFTRYLGATLRGVYLIDMADGPFTADAGGRIDLFGRSAVLFNVVRLYGGGGVQILAPAANTGGRSAKVGVGGHFGFEFFHNPYFSYFLEVGGQGGEPSPGATVVAGMMFYPWTR